MVTKITLGGRLDYWMSSTDVESMSYFEFEASVKAAYQCVSAEVGAESSTKTGSKIFALNMQIDAVGGDQGKIEAVKTEKTPSAFADWASTIKDDPYCIGQSLTPLWKMCENQNSADQLENEFKHQRAAFKLRHLVVFSRTWMPTTKTKSVGHDQDHTLEIPKEFKILSGGAEVVAIPGVERSGYHLFKASYPKSSNQWRAWSACHLWKDK